MALWPLLLRGRATSALERELPLATGEIQLFPGKPGLVIGAPHGTSDEATDVLGRQVARRTGFGLVLATGFAKIDAEGRRFNVNRPTEGVPGQPPSSEVYSAGARLIYERYVQRVKEAAQGPVRLLVELHGNARRESASRIEIATVGVHREQAWRLRTLWGRIRDAHLSAWPGAPRLEIAVEPEDRVYFSATGAKEAGVLRLPERGLHIELPRVARTRWRAAHVAILSQFVSETSIALEGWRA